MSIPQKSFIRAIKSKIIIALLLACFALFMAWGISKVVFNEMLNTVQNITAPSDRLRLVNKISRRISSLDQQQKSMALNDPGNYSQLFRESKQLKMVLDTLNRLYINDSIQYKRINSISTLLAERDKQFVDYLKVRERLVNNKSFSTEVKKLNNLVTKNTENPDSTIVTSEQRTSTTTIYPQTQEDKPKSFFNRIFGKKKAEESQALKVVNQENVRRDTISVSKETEVVKTLEVSLKAIEAEQKKKSASFLNREAVLANANDMLINQMLDILREVESEVVAQIDSNSSNAQEVVNNGIETIGLIMLVFFLLTIFLLYFILTDITRSNRYRKQLESAKDEAEYHSIAKQRFLSNMSHEIRTPLQSIIGYAELLKQQTTPRQKDIDAISQSSEHLLQIVNEVLDYNRITSGKFTFSQQTFHIGRLLEEVVSAMQPQAEAKSLVLRSETDLSPITYINGDPFRLKQILYNLLGNAIKFTHVGEVLLSAFYKRKGSDLHFTFIVKDTGIGFSEAESKKIFNEFEQVEAPERDILNQAGAGLGLNIVKALVENQGGRIYVQSKQGLGSSFTVYLTFSIADEAQIAGQQSGLISAGLLPFEQEVWVVDDDLLILDLCALIFEKNHIRYQSFRSPNEMLSADCGSDLAIILMDIRMPEMSGIELCRILRKSVGPDVKIFAMTAQVIDEPGEALLEDFDGIVQKPFKEQDLLSVFDKYNKKAVSDQPENDISFDTTALEKMTFGDAAQLEKILARFSEDTVSDIERLRALKTADSAAEIRLIVHRMAGRIAQIGARTLATEFRIMEMELSNTVFNENHRYKIETLLVKSEALIESIKERV
jgi:signal transduction histidine kinase/CheY-like chemotaxis protein/HPt (histidine-containing phosphotransfer) domain-containing protein